MVKLWITIILLFRTTLIIPLIYLQLEKRLIIVEQILPFFQPDYTVTVNMAQI